MQTANRQTDAIASALETALTTCAVPGAIVAAQRGGEPPVVVALGTDAHGQVIERGTIFPVVLVTKLALALAVLRLVDAGRGLDLDAPIGTYLPEASARAGPA